MSASRLIFRVGYRYRLFSWVGRQFLGNRVFAIANLTWKAAFRYRVFWVLTALLVAAVVGLPLLIKDDGTAQGLTQILLTYTLSAVTALLGFSTLWIACGSLARDIEECQMQVVTVKPIARWQIWLGKWIGLLALNATLLAVSGAAIFFLLNYRAQRLPADQQAILRREIFVARSSLKEPPIDYDAEAEKILPDVVKQTHAAEKDIPDVRKMLVSQIKNQSEVVPPAYAKRWVIDTGLLKNYLQDKKLQLRVKFRTSRYNDGQTYPTVWVVGDPDSSNAKRIVQMLPPESFQEFDIPNVIGADGKLTIDVANPPQNGADLLFDTKDGLEVLYVENSFGVNFVRGLAVIFCWLALLATIGLATGSLLSFPVAAFTSLAILVIGMSSHTLSNAIESRTPISSFFEKMAPQEPSFIDTVVTAVFSKVLGVIQLVEAFSPIDSLSGGRSITWLQLGSAFGQIVVLMGGIFIVLGITFFTRRELAAVQQTS